MPALAYAAGYTPPAHPDFFVQTPVSLLRCRNLTPVQKTTYDVLCSYADSTDTAYLGRPAWPPRSACPSARCAMPSMR